MSFKSNSNYFLQKQFLRNIIFKMTQQDKHCVLVFCKSIYSIFIGAGLVAILSLLASFYSELPHNISVDRKITQYIEFPENKQMLDEMSAKLAKEGSYLSDIEPAAGDNK